MSPSPVTPAPSRVPQLQGRIQAWTRVGPSPSFSHPQPGPDCHLQEAFQAAPGVVSSCVAHPPLWSLVVGAPGGRATPGSPATQLFNQGLSDRGNPSRRALGTVQGLLLVGLWGHRAPGAPLPQPGLCPSQPTAWSGGDAGGGRSPPRGLPGTAGLPRPYLLLVGSQTLPRWGQELSCPSFVF